MIDLTDYYEPLFSIDCMHNYYRDGYCTGLRVEPTAACHEMLTGYRLFFKRRHNGGLVIIRKKNTAAGGPLDLKPIIPLDAGSVFTFKIILKDPLFLNITNARQEAIGPYSVFVFANEPAAPDPEGKITVHSGELTGPIQAVGSVFRHPVTHIENPVSLAVYDESGLFLFNIPIAATMPAVDIDLHGYPEGIYEMRIIDWQGTIAESMKVFVSSDFLAPQLFGFLQVRIHQEILSHAQKQLAFILEFENRRINWLYEVCVEEVEESEPGSLDVNNITLENTPVPFSRRIIDDENRVIFSSDAPIELREQPHKGIQLKDVSDGDQKVLIGNMPNPEPGRLLKDGDSGLRSEMYLKIK